jgi:hypothetical protein
MVLTIYPIRVFVKYRGRVSVQDLDPIACGAQAYLIPVMT